MRDFETAEAAFYFAQREPDFSVAELSREGRRISELRRSDLGSAYVWQVIPIDNYAVDEVRPAPSDRLRDSVPAGSEQEAILQDSA